MSDTITTLHNIVRQQDKPPKKEQPLNTGDLTEVSEPEAVPGQHGRDGMIHRIEFVGGRCYRLRCRELSDGYMKVRHTAWTMSYIFAFDAAEAWAYRGEVPEVGSRFVEVTHP
ncbi:MAG: hypothetical protein OXQ31_22310 [Spirochaetaceae bacterium]|nr:hypothetical protein [Spirochaetaceae bacterium]MDE2767144.1 hypothetical protein [Chloroflexota bacterium]